MRAHRAALAIVRITVLAGIASVARAGVIVVDASGAGNFTDLAPAVAAAVDGDVLLVKSGVYSGFTILNEALDVVADAGASVRIDGRITVRQLGAARTVTLSGLEVHGVPGDGALELFLNSGAVRVQGCTLIGGNGIACSSNFASGYLAASLQSCADVVIERSTLVGGDGADTDEHAGRGAPALGGAGYRVALHDCILRGGRGANLTGTCPPSGYGYGNGYAGNGGTAANVSSMTAVFFAGCTLQGGDGGDLLYSPPYGSNGCGGGALTTITTPPSALHALDTTFASGTAGAGPFPCGPTPPISTIGAFVTMLSGTARHINATRVVREQHAVRIDVTGAPGERVELVLGARTRFLNAYGQRGIVLVARRPLEPVLDAGTIPPSGILTVGWTLPELGPGVASQRYFAQATCVDPVTGERTLTGVATMVFLDAAY